jgi:hypothetical protein
MSSSSCFFGGNFLGSFCFSGIVSSSDSSCSSMSSLSISGSSGYCSNSSQDYVVDSSILSTDFSRVKNVLIFSDISTQLIL